MPNLISRLYNFVDDANNGVPITALRVDSELNQLVNTQNQAAIVAATAPSSPINGELWIDSVNKQLKQYRNSEWVIMGVVHYGTVMATPQAGDVWIDNSGSEVVISYRNKANSAWIQISDANLWASPPALGGTTPNTGAFSTLKVGTTNQGDIPYDNGTSFVRLTPGITGQVLQTKGASANPLWANILASVLDYASSQSSSTSRQGSTLKVCYGTTGSVAGGSSVNVTNLPFSSGTSYVVLLGTYSQYNMTVTSKSGSQFTLTNTHGDDVGGNGNADWIAIGT